MGNKLAAKAAVARFNVPLVPGTAEPITDVSKAKKVAAEIGYPPHPHQGKRRRRWKRNADRRKRNGV